MLIKHVQVDSTQVISTIV